ncbi:hypothetical protein N7481_005165 [Penicillium waksmanii]|uniref:uncharacterized protein n=1 Tax=Penicillium waksmanii TaxID=69791 RepID=UPI0025472464|nr:uncharacterized protein N7481_005165 [Penicillium waksmanii]KAJ5983066.1 hypothetical protein N7481_005165 [Penicillium waksmanii]
MTQFPLVIDRKSQKTEKYGYAECEALAGQDASWHNCDSFAIIARALYMNTYYSDKDVLKRIADDKQPPATEVNGPNGFKVKKS